MEMWKPIKGYEDIYEVSDLGRVKQVIKNRILIQTSDKDGYLHVGLIKNKVKTHRVHRLVLNTFLPNYENKPTINHKNGIKNDNRLYNLEWSTYSENNKHAHTLGHVYTKKKVQCSNGMIFESSFAAAEWINNLFGNVKKIKTIASMIRGIAGGKNPIDKRTGYLRNSHTCYGYSWKYIN